jgi:guanyl-specific ribonuclease Sa
LVDPSGRFPIPPFLILGAASFIVGFAMNTLNQNQENNGWCGYDLFDAIGTGINFAAIASITALSVFSGGALLGMGLQGLAVLINSTFFFSTDLSVSATAGAAFLWFMTGKSSLPSVTTELNLPFKNPSLKSQINAVVTSFDETGSPPPNVAQGIRPGRIRGVFYNEPPVLPPQPSGYYMESDIWPLGSGERGVERLIFGQAGEVFYTLYHYAKGSIAQIR